MFTYDALENMPKVKEGNLGKSLSGWPTTK